MILDEAIRHYIKTAADNEKCTSLPIEEQGDMMMQYHAMVIYKMALYNRLERAGIAKTFIPQHESCG